MSASRFMQLGIYVRKNFRLFKNEKGWKTLIFAAIISLLVALVLNTHIFKEDTATWTGTFTLVSSCIWIGLFNSIQAICKERAVIKSEHFSGLHISSYVLARIVYDAVICVAESFIILVISSIVMAIKGIQFPTHNPLFISQYVEFFITYFFILFAADLLGLAISAIVHTPAVAMTVMPFVLIVQLIFCGALFTLPKGVDAVSAVTISKWGLNATCTSANYNDLDSYEARKIKNNLKKSAKENQLEIPVSDGEIDRFIAENIRVEAKPEYEHTFGHLVLPWLVLIIHCAVYTAVAIIALEFVDKDKR